MKIDNVKVYGLLESFKASKYPLAVDTNKVDSTYTNTIKALGISQKGEGHDNFLNGIIVQFDLTFSNKAWIEAERYHFLDFVSSQSTMHRISQMNIKECCNEYVDDIIIERCEQLQREYLKDKSDYNYLKLLYNIPSGFELTARMTTNYRQLKTIYAQRKTHLLPEWKSFCKWIETLPYAELITRV